MVTTTEAESKIIDVISRNPGIAAGAIASAVSHDIHPSRVRTLLLKLTNQNKLTRQAAPSRGGGRNTFVYTYAQQPTVRTAPHKMVTTHIRITIGELDLSLDEACTVYRELHAIFN